MALDDALRQFDITETNLSRLEDVWTRIEQIRDSPAHPEGTREYAKLVRAFSALADGLPPIDGFAIGERPMDIAEMELARFEAHEVGEPSALFDVERAIAAPGEAIDEYRFRFDRVRRELVRPRVRALITRVDQLLAELVARHEPDSNPVADDAMWLEMVEALAEIERLAGDQVQRRGRWSDLARHRYFALGVDLHDIAEHDWPSVRKDLEAALYTELEPLPTEATDLGVLVQAAPEGAVATRLRWDRLDDDGFERLVFNLIVGAPEYENARWDTRTRAADGSRDLEVDRVTHDTLAGTRRERVIVQCKHRTTKSIAPDDVLRALSDVRTHWEPPNVDLLIIVTSGRFTSDAVKTIQAHNERSEGPRIDWWAESRLESVLSTRTRLVTELGLRASS